MKKLINTLNINRIMLYTILGIGLFSCSTLLTTPTSAPTTTTTPSEDMLPVDYLGVGYDAVRVDPENLAINSVNNKSLVPPTVFELKPSQNTFFTVIKDRGDGKDGQEKMIVPIGVKATAGERSFVWSDKTRWARNASQFQHSFSHSYSGSIGIPDLASVTLSASFEDVQKVTSSAEAAYVYKDAYYNGHILTIDMLSVGPDMLAKPFVDAVSTLGTTDPSAYDNFIQKWGTHFSLEKTMGAKCYYRFTLTKSGYSNSNKSKKEFDEGIEVSLDKIGGKIGASQVDEQINKAEQETSAKQTTFKSFGGSGGLESFSEWSKDAQHNPTIIDIRLTSYLELFNQKFFPDDSQITTKHDLLKAALDRYYKKNNYTESIDPADFYKKETRDFRVTVKRLYVRTGYKDNSQDERLYGGILKLGVYSKLGDELKSIRFMNLNGGAWLDAGQWKYNCIKKKQGETKDYSNYNFNITLTPDQLSDSFATITGEMTQTWLWGADTGKKSMGFKNAFDTDNALRSQETISLIDLKKGDIQQAHVTYTNTDAGEGDVVEIYFDVKRIR